MGGKSYFIYSLPVLAPSTDINGGVVDVSRLSPPFLTGAVIADVAMLQALRSSARSSIHLLELHDTTYTSRNPAATCRGRSGYPREKSERKGVKRALLSHDKTKGHSSDNPETHDLLKKEVDRLTSLVKLSSGPG